MQWVELGMDAHMTPESSLPDVIGVSRKHLVEFRKECFEGVDWVYEPSRRRKSLWRVLWTQAGMMKVRAHFKLEPVEVQEMEKMAGEVKREWDAVVVSKVRNPRILMCRVDGEDVKVLVRDNSKFLPGMRVPLRKDAGRWVAARHPRFGGKW